LSQLFASTPGISNFYVVLVRDPRGVVASRIRSAFRRKATGTHPNPFALFSRKLLIARDAQLWNSYYARMINFEALRDGANTIYLSYDSFVEDPIGWIHSISTMVSGSDGATERIELDKFPIKRGHVVKGNRLRGNGDGIVIRADDSYRAILSRVESGLTNFFTRHSRHDLRQRTA
jgi:hypothetical protein